MKASTPAPRAYYSKLSAEKADALYIQILEKLTKEKRYRDPHYSAAQLAKDLGTNTRYIAAAVALSTGNNYAALINGLRLRDACRALCSPRFTRATVEEVGLWAGFSSRQSFYNAFSRVYACTPKEYRLNNTKKS